MADILKLGWYKTFKISVIFNINAASREEKLIKLGTIVVGHRCDIINNNLVRLGFHIRHTMLIVVCENKVDMMQGYRSGANGTH